MSTLNELLNKSPSQTTDLDWAVISLEPNSIVAERAAEELESLRCVLKEAIYLAGWMRKNGIDGTPLFVAVDRYNAAIGNINVFQKAEES